ncbi:MAG: tRNA (N(6)-L-threonylcarbamoyladenosine(37)-C(2))-methylthiotransferase MtaB [Clostridiales bacterium]|nr:tRNA (N(6)-L-threonylcarbamoyladenosine(37)-C(2))-methylthiotransferase MtaB [Clostridiales bacterium]
MNVSFYTFGCPVNNYESQEMKNLFVASGYQVVEGSDSDVVIINSCAVTKSVERGSIEIIKRIRKKNPDAIVALVGCYGELLKGKSKPKDVDVVLGNDKFGIVKAINSMLCRNSKERSNRNSSEYKVAKQSNSSFHSILQIQNGCNNYCSYCIVPYLRGTPSSKPLDAIKAKLDVLVAKGCTDVLLAGINIGLYNSDGNTLADTLKFIDGFDGIHSIRLSSLEPMTINQELLDTLPKITKLQPHLHISLQSGSNKILSLMNRNYSFEEYLSLITEIRQKINGISITTDVIVGFPGESDNDFKLSCNHIVQCEFSDIHIFKYSNRNGTTASKIPNQITAHKKLARVNILEGIRLQACYSYHNEMIGSIQKVTLYKSHSAKSWEGIIKTNMKIFVESETVLNGGTYNVRITGISTNCKTLVGVIVEYTKKEW